MTFLEDKEEYPPNGQAEAKTVKEKGVCVRLETNMGDKFIVTVAYGPKWQKFWFYKIDLQIKGLQLYKKFSGPSIIISKYAFVYIFVLLRILTPYDC